MSHPAAPAVITTTGREDGSRRKRVIKLLTAPTDAQLTRDVLRLAVPSAAGMLSHTVLMLADTAMVGRLGEEALAAVGLGSYATLIAIAALGAVQVGTQAIVGRRVGEGRPREAGRVVANALALTLLLGSVLSLLGWLLAAAPFAATRDAAVAEAGASYVAVRALGLLPAMVGFAVRGFLFGVGRMRAAMWLMLAVNGLNIALNGLLIFGAGPIPALGVAGAAWATTIAVAAGAAGGLLVLRGRAIRERFDPLRADALDREVMKGIVRVAAPRVLQALTLSCFFVFVALIEQLGTAEAAAANIILKVHSLPFHLAMGTGLAAATLIAQSLGAGRPDLAERYGRCAVRAGVLVTVIVGGLLAAGSRGIVGLFTTDPAVVLAGALPFAIVALAHAVDTVAIVYARALHGAGDTRWVLFAEILCGWGVLVSTAYVLAVVVRAPATVVWLAYVAYMVALAAAHRWRFESGRWKTIRV